MATNANAGDLGKNIARLRLAKGWERARLARAADVDTRTLYNIERGFTRTLRSELLERVAKALDVQVTDLRGETPFDSLPAGVREMLGEELLSALIAQAQNEGRDFMEWFPEWVSQKYESAKLGKPDEPPPPKRPRHK